MKNTLLFFLLLFFFVIFLKFSSSPIKAYTNNMSASTVLGQPDFASKFAGTSASSLNGPRGMAICDGKFVLAELNNNRVLIWNSIPTRNNQPADVVVGQPDFISNTADNGGITASSLKGPFGVGCDSGKLFVTAGNNRVLIWNTIPTTNFAPADVVVCQPDFTSSTRNNGGIGPRSCASPSGVVSDGTRLFVLDTGDDTPGGNNTRLLIFNSIPTTNFASADVVVGQPDFTTQGASCAANKLGHDPLGVFVGGGKLIIGDTFQSTAGNRVVIFNSIPTTNGASADVVVGQPNFTSCSINQGGGAGTNTLNKPFGVFVDDKGKLLIADRSNQRILVFNSIPSSNNASADVVIGQSNFTNTSINQGGSTPAANTLSGARFVMAHGNKLFISDADNNRVLIYENVFKVPQISVNSTEPTDAGKLRFKGNVNIDSLYNIKSIEYSLNGGNYIGLGPSDGSFDEASEDFSFDFDPKTNGNDKYPGYVLKIRSMNSNLDASEFAYFQPFIINQPKNNLTTTNPSPTFSFSINRGKFEVLKSVLSKFRIMIKDKNYKGSDWAAFIDNIPTDFESVKSTDENLHKLFYLNKITNGNGIFENKDVKVEYSNNNSEIKVTPKKAKLERKTYQFKIVSESKSLITQETETREITVTRGVSVSTPTTFVYQSPLPTFSPIPKFLAPTSRVEFKDFYSKVSDFVTNLKNKIGILFYNLFR